MKRRDFHGMLTIGLGAVGTSALAQAGAPVEGVHYLRLSKPAPVSAPTGKIEVVEFFWYGCPHRNALEPALEAWVRRLPADVAFRRVPVAFSATHETHQKLYYALEAMGALEKMHPRVFAAIHNQRQRLDRDADQAAFVRANGLDGDKFLQAGKSFTVQTRMRQARQLAQAYDVDGVPTLGVHGRFYTGGALAGDNVRALAVAEVLIDRVRRNV